MFNHYKTIFENNKSIFAKNTDVEKFLSSIIRKVENKKEEMEKSKKKVCNIDTMQVAKRQNNSGAKPNMEQFVFLESIKIHNYFSVSKNNIYIKGILGVLDFH